MKRDHRHHQMYAAVLAALFLSACSKPEAPPSSEVAAAPEPPAEVAVAPAFPERPFFGDTHLHTSYSVDAGAFGARLTPRDAYRVRQGQ